MCDNDQSQRELRSEGLPTNRVVAVMGLPSRTGRRAEREIRPAATVTPQLAKRVHDFYQELGRADLLAVEASEREDRKDDTPPGGTPNHTTDPATGA